MQRANTQEVRRNVQDVYRQVADEPGGDFHFERGRNLAEKLGYPAPVLDQIPPESLESFAGVGFPFGLVELRENQRVLDLGSGSGMDVFFASRLVGDGGLVTGLDMTDAQLEKAERLRKRHGVSNATFVHGYIEEIPLDDDSIDLVVSNGVINLSTRKEEVFREIARVLAPAGRMAVSDIVTERPLSDDIVCDASLWAACIGGAAQIDDYRAMIENAGLEVTGMVEHPEYRFLSKSAQGASREYGVKSVSVSAELPG